MRMQVTREAKPKAKSTDEDQPDETANANPSNQEWDSRLATVKRAGEGPVKVTKHPSTRQETLSPKHTCA